MPKQNQSETLSLPQLLQLAGIGGQPQQDSTREALGYMMGQQRLQADDADRKVRMQQAEQENQYRMKALDAQVNQKDNTAALHALGLLYANTMDPTERARIGAHISSLTGMPAAPTKAPEKTYENDPKLQAGYKPAATIAQDGIGTALGQAVNKFDPTTIAENAGNEIQNQLMNFIYSAGGYDPGPRIPTPLEDATAQFVSDAQYNTNKHAARQAALRQMAGRQPKY